MKQNIRKSIVLLLSLLVILMCIPIGMTQADYSYRVRVFAGNQSNVSNPEMPIIDLPFSPGAECNLPRSKTIEETYLPEGSKYYVKGYKISGEGGEYTCHSESFIVDRDYDLMVAYGMPDNLVSYTINFVDAETGAQLADSVTYYGNVGDKPVVAYEYIEGYRPLYRNISGTLSADGNVWSFPYLRLVREEPTTQAPAPVQQPAAAAGTQGQAAEQPANANGEVIQSEEAGGGTQTNATAGTNTQTAQPQAAGTEGQNAAGGNTPAPAPAGNEGTNTPAGNQNANVPAPAVNEGGNTPVADQGGNNGGNAGGNNGGNAGGNTGGIDLGGNAGVLTDPELYEFADTEDILDLDVPLAAPTVKNDVAEGKDGKEDKDGKDDKEVTDGTEGSEDVTASTTSEADPNTTTSAKGLSTPLIIIIVAACAVIIIIILLLVFRKKK